MASAGDLRKPESLFRLVCRPALPKDTPEVLALTSKIWDGGDYVPEVWNDWMADPEGLLAVAEFGGRVVGISKLSRMGPEDWWLEGLRVHPEYEGRGIASHLHDYMVEHWQRSLNGSLRLVTASFRLPVQHLCERSGFVKAGEFSAFNAPVIDEPVNSFTPVEAAESEQALELIQNSLSMPLSYGMINLGWRWSPPTAAHLAEAISLKQAWWWRKQPETSQGLLTIIEDDEDDDVKNAVVQTMACPVEKMVELLVDFRRLAKGMGYQQAAWLAPLNPLAVQIAAEAGFERGWDASVFLYE
ncbi:MAG: GNAT family N-acetyltransferase, partial [Chloroflexota bacterium]